MFETVFCDDLALCQEPLCTLPEALVGDAVMMLSHGSCNDMM